MTRGDGALDFIGSVDMLREWRIVINTKLDELPLHPLALERAHSALSAMDDAIHRADLLTAARLCKGAIDALTWEANLLACTGGEPQAAEIRAAVKQLRSGSSSPAAGALAAAVLSFGDKLELEL